MGEHDKSKNLNNSKDLHDFFGFNGFFKFNLLRLSFFGTVGHGQSHVVVGIKYQ